jgi:hypothetical protein
VLYTTCTHCSIICVAHLQWAKSRMFQRCRIHWIHRAHCTELHQLLPSFLLSESGATCFLEFVHPVTAKSRKILSYLSTGNGRVTSDTWCAVGPLCSGSCGSSEGRKYMTGFSQVISPSRLQCFQPCSLYTLESLWPAETLNHGVLRSRVSMKHADVHRRLF